MRRPRWTAVTLLSLAVCTLAACAPDADTPASGAAERFERDSAGITIARHEVEPDRVLDVREALRLGVVDGTPELQFSNITGIEVAPDRGEVYVADARAASIRVFDLEGGFLRAFGRSGEGPGEFDFLLEVDVAGDTVVALDRRSVHRFHPDGTVIDTEATGTGAISSPEQASGAPDGLRVLVLETGQGEDGGRGTWLRVLRLDSAEGLVRPPIYEIRLDRDRIELPSGRRIDPWLAHGIGFGMDGAGRTFVTPVEAYEIHIVGADGVLERIHRLESERVPVDPEVVEAALSADEERCRQPNAPPGCMDFVDAMRSVEPPPFVPVIAGITMGDDGHTLVRRRDVGWDPIERAAPPVYDLIDPDGRFVGRLDLPEDFTPHWLDGDEIWGVDRDDLDVPYVVRLSLVDG